MPCSALHSTTPLARNNRTHDTRKHTPIKTRIACESVTCLRQAPTTRGVTTSQKVGRKYFRRGAACLLSGGGTMSSLRGRHNVFRQKAAQCFISKGGTSFSLQERYFCFRSSISSAPESFSLYKWPFLCRGGISSKGRHRRWNFRAGIS